MKGFESLRVESHPGNLPFLKTFLMPALLIVPAIFLSAPQMLIAMWAAVALVMMSDSESRLLLKTKRQELQIVRWFMLAAGISEDMIRVSAGLEHIKDIQADFGKGLRAASKVAQDEQTAGGQS